MQWMLAVIQGEQRKKQGSEQICITEIIQSSVSFKNFTVFFFFNY